MDDPSSLPLGASANEYSAVIHGDVLSPVLARALDFNDEELENPQDPEALVLEFEVDEPGAAGGAADAAAAEPEEWRGEYIREARRRRTLPAGGFDSEHIRDEPSRMSSVEDEPSGSPQAAGSQVSVSETRRSSRGRTVDGRPPDLSGVATVSERQQQAARRSSRSSFGRKDSRKDSGLRKDVKASTDLVMLQELNVANADFGDLGFLMLAELLRGNRTLNKLDVRGNVCTEEGARPLLNRIFDRGDPDSVKSLNEVSSISIYTGRVTEYLDLRGRKLGDFEALLLVELAKSEEPVKNIDVRDNVFSLQGIKYLRRAAPFLNKFNNISLRRLREDSVQSNVLKVEKVADVDAYLLAAGLRFRESWEKLREIRLPEAKLSLKGGVKALGDALANLDAFPALQVVQAAEVEWEYPSFRSPTLNLPRTGLRDLQDILLCLLLLRNSAVETISVPSPCDLQGEWEPILRAARDLWAAGPRLRKVGYLRVREKTEEESVWVREPLRGEGVGEFEAIVVLAERVEAKQPASIELPRAKAGVVLAEVVLAVAEEIPVSLGGIALEPRDGSATLAEQEALDCVAKGWGNFELRVLARLLAAEGSRVERVDLMRNEEVTEAASQELLAALAQESCSVRFVSSLPVWLLRKSADELWKSSSPEERAKTSRLDLTGKGLGPVESVILAKLLTDSEVIHELKLRRNPQLSWNVQAEAGSMPLKSALLRAPHVHIVSDIPLREIREGKTELDLRGFDLGPVEGHLLVHLLQDPQFPIVSLDLRENDLGDEVSQALVEALPSDACKSLQDVCTIPVAAVRQNKQNELALADRNLGPFEVSLILALIKNAHSIKKLDLNGNPRIEVGKVVEPLLKIESMAQVGGVKAFALKQVRESSAYELPLEKEIGEFDFRVVGECCNASSTLEHITLDSVVFGEGAIDEFVKACRACRDLKKVNDIPVGLLRRSTVEILELQGQKSCATRWGDPEAALLTEYLRDNDSLKVLEMNCEQISDERCEALAQVAVRHKALQRVCGVPVHPDDENRFTVVAQWSFHLCFFASVLAHAPGSVVALTSESLGQLRDVVLAKCAASIRAHATELNGLSVSELFESGEHLCAPNGFGDLEAALVLALQDAEDGSAPVRFTSLDWRGLTFGPATAKRIEKLVDAGSLEKFGDVLLADLDDEDVDLESFERLGDLEAFVIGRILGRNHSSGPFQKRKPRVTQLNLGEMKVEAAFARNEIRKMVDKAMDLENVGPVPVAQLRKGDITELVLARAPNKAEALVLARCLEKNKTLKLLALSTKVGGDSGDSGESGGVAALWEAATILVNAADMSPNDALTVSLWEQPIAKKDCGRMGQLMQKQLEAQAGGASDNADLGDFADTPLARLCQIPFTQIENNELDQLVLKDLGISDFEMNILRELIKKNESLRRIDLRGNPKVSQAATKSLCEILKKRQVQVTQLSGISTAALGSSSQRLALDGQDLGDNEAVILAEFMPSENKALTSIDLKGNQFTSAAVPHILEVLKKCKKLDMVSSLPYKDIIENKRSDFVWENKGLGEFEAFLLADMIRKNGKNMMNGANGLSRVSVQGNNFYSPEAALKLAEAVHAHGKISPFNQYNVKAWHSGETQRITLAKNDPPLGDFDATLVANLFRGSASLRSVDLSDNELTLVGIREVIKVLPSLPALEEVKLQGNVYLDCEALASIMKELEPVTASVNVWGIPTSEQDREIATSIFTDSISSSAMRVDVETLKVMERILRCPEVQKAVSRLDFEGIALTAPLVRKLFQAIPDRFTLNIWGMEITPEDFPIISPLIEGDTVDIFSIASRIGQRHGSGDSPSRDSPSRR
jgi:Ran GTPase-activating protein (RanGAP) involved in mRNA processing and transport